MNPSSPPRDRKLRILYVAYPLLPVSEHSAGGAEQVLWTLEREMHARGHHTVVAACSRSEVAGELFSTGEPAQALDEFEARSHQQTQMVLDWLGRRPDDFDIIHDMSGNFWQHAGKISMPVLATLHLPRSLYKNVNFEEIPNCVFFNCVSHSQASEFSDLPRVCAVVPNGIAVEHFPREPLPIEKREYLLWLGRICEEKGTHTALDVAHAAGAKIIIAGAVYPFLYHQKYFAREIIPRMKRVGSQAKYIESPSFTEKVELLRNARALLITSEVNETSSLVAMEAAASGTPVLALRRGALAEVVGDGVTGFLVNSATEMPAALARIGELDPRKSQQWAKEKYSSARMADGYIELYRRLTAGCESKSRTSTAIGG